MSKWFYQADGGAGGPVTEGQLRSLHAQGKIKPTTFVYEESPSGQWKKYEEAFPGAVASPSLDTAAAVQPPPLPPENSAGGRTPTPLEARVNQKSAGTAAGSQTSGAQADGLGIQMQSTDPGSGSRLNFRRWGLIVAFVIAAWWGISKYRAYRTEVDKRESMRLVGELERGEKSLGNFDAKPGLEPLALEYSTAIVEAKRRFAEESYGKARAKLQQAQSRLNLLRHGIQKRADALALLISVGNKTKEVVPSLPWPAGFRDQIRDAQISLIGVDSNILSGSFDQAIMGASNVLQKLAPLEPALVSFKQFQSQMDRLSPNDASLLKQYGGTNAAKLFIALTNVTIYGPTWAGMAGSLSNLATLIPDILAKSRDTKAKQDQQKELEEENSFLDKLKLRLDSAGEKAAALVQLRDHVAAKPNYTNAAARFDSEASSPKTWLEWATAEAESAQQGRADAWMEIVRCIRDLKIIQDFQRSNGQSDQGILGEDYRSAVQQAIVNVINVDFERRWDLLVLVSQDFECSTLRLLIDRCAGSCTSTRMQGLWLARMAGIADRLGNQELGNSLFKTSQSVAGNTLLPYGGGANGDLATLLWSARAIGRLDPTTAQSIMQQSPIKLYWLRSESLQVFVWIAQTAAKQGNSVVVQSILDPMQSAFRSREYIADYMEILLWQGREQEVLGYREPLPNRDAFRVQSAITAYRLRAGRIDDALALCSKMADAPTKVRLEAKCKMVQSGGRPSALLAQLPNENDPANRCAAYAAIAVCLAGMPPKTP